MPFQSIDLGTQGTQSGDTIRNAFLKVNSNFVDAQSQIDGKADAGHVHDSRYYTQSQVDAGFLPLNAKAADSNLLDGIDSISFERWASELSGAIASAGWVTIANFTGARGHVEFYIYDTESGDHAFMHIEAIRSYAGSSVVVLNTGGHSRRITGARFIEDSSNVTYANKKLQVYVTTASTYKVRAKNYDKIGGWATVSRVSPVLENTPSGYVLQGQVVNMTHEYGGMGSSGVGYFGSTVYEGGTALSTRYLGLTAKAADANLLDGHDSTYFSVAHSHPYRSDTWVPAWTDITGKPSTFAPSAHSHAISEVTGLQTALDGKAATHTHPYRLDSWVPAWGDITGKPSTFTPSAHTHSLSEISNSETGGEIIVADGTGGLVGSGKLSDGLFMLDNPLSDISDVTISTIVSGEILKWSGSAWINQTLSEAGIAPTSHTHSYLPLGGGTVTGATTFSNALFALSGIGLGSGDVLVREGNNVKRRTASNILKDAKGVPSADGSVRDLSFNSNTGELIVKYSDATTWTSGKMFTKI